MRLYCQHDSLEVQAGEPARFADRFCRGRFVGKEAGLVAWDVGRPEQANDLTSLRQRCRGLTRPRGGGLRTICVCAREVKLGDELGHRRLPGGPRQDHDLADKAERGGVDELALLVHLCALEPALDDGAVHDHLAGLGVQDPAEVGEE
jgi:hypothetical protein